MVMLHTSNTVKKWWRGVAVTLFIRSTKLFYTERG